MSENLNRGNRDFSRVDTMATEDLEKLLRLDAMAPEGEESDTELLLYVMEVLTVRKRNSQSTGNTAQEAWESFQKHYMPEEAKAAEPVSAGRRSFSGWGRRAVAAAVVLALLLFVPLTASALNWEELWQVFASWAQETFSFVSDREDTVSDPAREGGDAFSSLEEALQIANKDFIEIPSWIPDRFAFADLTVETTPFQYIFIAYFSNTGEETASIKFRVHAYVNSDPEIIEINNELLETYMVDGVEYHIFSNNQQLRAVWSKDSYTCYISGDITMEEMKAMIDSIGKG